MLPPSETAASRPHLILTAGGRRFALDLDVVEEVRRHGRVLPVPGAAAWLTGMVACRGRVLSLADAGALFGAGNATGDWMVVLKGLSVNAALRVDGSPRLPDTNSSPEFTIDLAALAGHEAFQFGAAGPERNASGAA